MKKNKILIITKEARGGNYTFLKQITKLEKKGFEIRHFFLKKDNLVRFENKSVSAIDNIYPTDNKPSIYKSLLFTKNLYKAYKVFKKENPDILLATDLYSIMLLFAIRPFFSKKQASVAFINNNLLRIIEGKPNYFFRYTLESLFKICINKIDLVIVPSHGLQSLIANAYMVKRIVVINHGIDIKYIDKINANNKYKSLKTNNNIKFLSVGRLEEQKDFKTLLKAFSLLIDKYKNIELLIMGEGSQRFELEKLAENLSINNNIVFLGWKKNIFPYLNASDVFVFSSRYEGFGFVILEAMAAKLPVIATNSPYGPAEILDKGKFGILVPVGDYRKIAKEMEELLNNSTKRKSLSKIGYERVKDFDLNKILSLYSKVLSDLIYEKKNKISNSN